MLDELRVGIADRTEGADRQPGHDAADELDRPLEHPLLEQLVSHELQRIEDVVVAAVGLDVVEQKSDPRRLDVAHDASAPGQLSARSGT